MPRRLRWRTPNRFPGFSATPAVRVQFACARRAFLFAPQAHGGRLLRTPLPCASAACREPRSLARRPHAGMLLAGLSRRQGAWGLMRTADDRREKRFSRLDARGSGRVSAPGRMRFRRVVAQSVAGRKGACRRSRPSSVRRSGCGSGNEAAQSGLRCRLNCGARRTAMSVESRRRAGCGADRAATPCGLRRHSGCGAGRAAPPTGLRCVKKAPVGRIAFLFPSKRGDSCKKSDL